MPDLVGGAPGVLVTRPGHIQYGGLLLGPGTPYRWKELPGWEDLPPLDSGTVPRPAAHGAYPGQLLAQTRTITVEGLMVRAPRATIGAAVAELGAGTVPVETELPFVVWLDERGPLLAYARVTRRAIPTGIGYRVGTITGAALEFVATDPRRYELEERSAWAGLPAPEPGLDWHDGDQAPGLDWPLEFGEPGSTGTLTATNAGSAATHPVVEFRGPVDRPSITNVTTGDVLEYDLPLSADDVLIVDTGAGTVTLNGSTSRLYTVTARSVPEQTWTLPPGTTDLLFRAAPESADSAARCIVHYRSAYW
ncbi:hypothetical protein ACFZB5_33410 [Streptomyces nodosus]|uniref:phage distal tail protein n=1 Tax=Streptomyces nodosus TaxID=40318 RepID=UPI0036EEEED1